MRTYLSLVGVATVVLSPILWTELLCDDYQYWLRYQIGESSLRDVTAVQGGGNRPLTTASLIFLTGIFSANPTILAALRLLHHCANALLVGIVVRRTWQAERATSFLASLLFLVWSSHAEVYWQSTLHDIAAASFSLSALAVLMSRPATFGRLFLLWSLSLLAYTSKEAAWCLPFVALVITLKAPKEERNWRGLACVSLAVLPYMVVRFFLLRDLWGDVVPARVSEASSIALVAKSISKLVVRSIVPGWIKVDGLHSASLFVMGTLALLVVGLVLAIVFVPRVRSAFARALNRPYTTAGIAYALCLLPVAKLSVSLENSENLRYLYLPTGFLAMTLATAWQDMRRTGARYATVGIAALTLFQAASLHAIGWNWISATRDMREFRPALEELVAKNPQGKRFLLACVPDNYRGAFSARNASVNLVAAIYPYRSRTVEVLASEYVRRNAEPFGCDHRIDDGNLILTARSGRHALTHPLFFERTNPVSTASMTMEAPSLKRFRAQHLQLQFEQLRQHDILAIYRQGRFEMVPTERLSGRAGLLDVRPEKTSHLRVPSSGNL